MSRQQLPSQIRKVELTSRRNGRPEIRYEVRLDVGTNGQRHQVKRRYRTEQEARNALGRTIDQRASGTYILKTAVTMREVVEQWLAGKTGLRPTSWNHLRDYLKPVIDLYGDMPCQDLKKAHIDTLLRRLAEGDIPRRDKQTRRKWSGTSRHHLLQALSRVLDNEVMQGHLPRNVALLVDKPRMDSEERPTFTPDEVQKLLNTTKDDVYGIAWQLALTGLRRAEIAGLTWDDIDMDAHELTIRRTRVVVNGKVEIGTPKTARSTRTLPIPDPLYSALLHTRASQMRRQMVGEYVVVNEQGRPPYPDHLSDEWVKACQKAKVQAIKLHDARHTCATLLHLQGVPIVTVSAWMGHATASFTMQRYTHNQPGELLKAATVHAGLSRDVSTKQAS